MADSRMNILSWSMDKQMNIDIVSALPSLRIAYCDGRPFCSALLELGYIFGSKVY